MRKYIIADNQELTRFALESLLRKDEENVIYRAFDRSGLVDLLREHESAAVLLDYTLFDFADEDQLLIIAERFNLSDWLLISDELTPQFIRRLHRVRPPKRLLPSVSQASTPSPPIERTSSVNWV